MSCCYVGVALMAHLARKPTAQLLALQPRGNSRLKQGSLLCLLRPRAPRCCRAEGLLLESAKLLSLRTGLVFEVLEVAIEPASFTVMLKLTEKPIEQRAPRRLELWPEDAVTALQAVGTLFDRANFEASSRWPRRIRTARRWCRVFETFFHVWFRDKHRCAHPVTESV